MTRANERLAALQLRWQLTKTEAAIWAAMPGRVRRRKAARPYLKADVDGSAASRLKNEGITPWPIAPENLRRLLSAYGQIKGDRASGRIAAAERHTAKKFFRPDLSLEDLRCHPAFWQLALEPQVLDLIINATGLIPHLEAIEVMVSDPVPGEYTASQLWHRDVNDRVIIKLFVYLNDVGPENGPVRFIPSSFSRHVPKTLPHYASDERIREFVSEDRWAQIEGKAGTAFLIDTHNCLHCGSRCQQTRVSYIATYSSGVKYMPQARSWGLVLGDDVHTLSELQRRVCGVSPGVH